MLYDFGGGQAYASFGVAQREPNRNDYTENPTITRPTHEKLNNTEVGIRSQRGRLNYGANLYYMGYRNQLVLTGELNDVGQYIRANVPKSFRLGAELQAGYRFEKLTVGGNLTLSRNRVKRYAEFVDDFDEGGQIVVLRENTPLAFSPSVTGAAEVEYTAVASERHRLAAALQAKYVGERFVDNSGSRAAALAGYYYADLRFSYRFSPKESPLGALRLTVLVRNLTDRSYFSNGWSYRFVSGGEVNYPTGACIPRLAGTC